MQLKSAYVVLIILLTAAHASALSMSSKRDCVVCHVMWSDDFRTDQEPLIEFQPGNVLMEDTQGVVSSEEICYSCHDGYVKDSRHITWKFNRHPVFVKPSKNVAIPDDMPLSVKGEIYCGTCHSAHGKGAASHGDPAGRTKVFREPNVDSGLCERCHRNEAAYRSSSGHPLHTSDLELSGALFTSGSKKAVRPDEIICETCHRVHGAEGGRILIIRNDDSQLCIICHEKQKFLIDTKHDLRVSLPDERNIKQQTLSESGPCGACHTAHNSEGIKLWAKPLKRGNPASTLCLSCHGEDTHYKKKRIGAYSHPVDVSVSPKTELPDNLPLFAKDGKRMDDGEIQCFTCHDIHRWDPDSPENRGGKDIEGDSTNSFLRVSNASSFMCLECHTDKKQVLMSDHNLLVTAAGDKNVHGFTPEASGPCGACHIPHNAVSDPLWARELPGDRDYITRLCTSCHNERGAGKKKLAGDNDHPVDVVLQGTRMTTELPLFDDRGTKTEEGKVACLTCHDPHTWDPVKTSPDYPYRNIEGDASNSFLRISNNLSAMCMECHRDKKQVVESDHNLMVTAPDEKNIEQSVPAASGPCGACHIPHHAAAKPLWARALPGDRDFATRLCTSCHSEKGPGRAKMAGDFSHPVDISMARPDVSTGLPLYDNTGRKDDSGKVVCLTCHDPHTWDPEGTASDYTYQNMEGDGANSFLRAANLPSAGLCSSCHRDKIYLEGTDHDLTVTAPDVKNLSGQTVRDSGTCGACHLVHNSPNRLKLWARPYGKVPADGEIIDSLCTSCHSPGNIAGNKIPLVSTHPDNVIINNTLRLDRTKEDFVPLFDKHTGAETRSGNVSCPLCHNAHQWNPRVKEKGAYENLEGNALNSFLRNLSYDNVCIDCHGLDALFRFKYFHDPDDRMEKGLPEMQPPAY